MAEFLLSLLLIPLRLLRRPGAAPFPLVRLLTYLVCAGLLLNAWLPGSW
jgi:hypothetical protein